MEHGGLTHQFCIIPTTRSRLVGNLIVFSNIMLGMREVFISLGAQEKRKTTQEVTEITETICSLESLNQTQTSSDTNKQLRDLRHQLSQLSQDDVVLSLSDPLTYLNSLKSVLEDFSLVSLYKVNTSKSHMIPITLNENLKKTISVSSGFSWAPHFIIKYLGIKLTSPSSSIHLINYNAEFLSLKQQISKVQTTHLSWVGRVAVVKISLLPTGLFRSLSHHLTSKNVNPLLTALFGMRRNLDSNLSALQTQTKRRNGSS